MPGRMVLPGGIQRSRAQRENRLNAYCELNVEARKLMALEKGVSDVKNVPILKKFLEKLLPFCDNMNPENSLFDKKTCSWVASELQNLNNKKSPSEAGTQLENIIRVEKRLTELIQSFR
ncbi:MAG: hypothetical protein ACP5NW_04015 [Candidatus Woesearchaeota archaeon]